MLSGSGTAEIRSYTARLLIIESICKDLHPFLMACLTSARDRERLDVRHGDPDGYIIALSVNDHCTRDTRWCVGGSRVLGYNGVNNTSYTK